MTLKTLERLKPVIDIKLILKTLLKASTAKKLNPQ